MPFRNLQDFVHRLEARGLVRRIQVEVDPILEAGEIAQRVLREGGPVLLFENPKGARFPLLMNLFGTMERVRLALGREPSSVADELLGTIERMTPPSVSGLWESRHTLLKGLTSMPRTVGSAPVQEVAAAPDLDALPVLQCWPGDGGRFITYGMVITRHPGTARRNFGLYRLQVFDQRTTGMHWQSMKGGRGHHWEAERRGQDLPVAVVIGCDPILMMASILPLPEDVDEVMFAGFLRGKGVPMVRATSVDALVPAEAEFILEGVVRPHDVRREGPFGDHFGHYSEAADFPVFHVQAMTHRRNPVYVATVVGKPPQEDKFLGIAAGEMIGPLIRVINPNVVGVHAYVGAGFHNLLVVALDERHPKESMKTAMSLLGTGQLSLTKVMVLVPGDVDPSGFRGVLSEIWRRVRPEDHLHLLGVMPLDTLDFTSGTMHVGSKLVIDATGEIVQAGPPQLRDSPERFDRRVQGWKQLDGGFLVIVVAQEPRAVIRTLIDADLGMRFIVAVSPDVDLDDDENLEWGIFTRFDPVRDMMFSAQEFVGARPVYRGAIGIDATWKDGYPEPLEMDDETLRRVDRRWSEYGLL
jgi:4-hydroxy-3-polyprenylbenzoate decarboxylase